MSHVYVFPAPVAPYANTVPLNPSKTPEIKNDTDVL